MIFRLISRRDFLKLAGIGVASTLTACTPIGKATENLVRTATSTVTPKPSSTPKGTRTPTQTAVPVTSTPTATETAIPTPEKLIDRYKVTNGKLMQRTQSGWSEIPLPSGVERVDYTEMHNGSLYMIGIFNGVDNFATAKFNGREWERYERPIRIAFGSEILVKEWPENFRQQITEKHDVSEIKRLKDKNDKFVPFGILEETSMVRNNGTTVYFEKLSGFLVGIYTFDTPTGPSFCDYLMYEVPLRYGTQIFTCLMINDEGWGYNIGLISSDRNIDNPREITWMKGRKLSGILNKTEALENQMIIQARFPVMQDPNKEAYKKQMQLLESLKKDECIEIDAGFDAAGEGEQYIFDESLLK